MDAFAGASGVARCEVATVDDPYAWNDMAFSMAAEQPIATIGRIRIVADPEDGAAAYVVDGNRLEGPFGWEKEKTLGELMERVPALQHGENLAAYARVMLAIKFGSAFSPLIDEEDVDFCRRFPFGERVNYDLSSIAPPHVQGDRLVFFATNPGLGSVPYRITVPYPYREDVPGRAELLPFRKKEQPIPAATATDGT
ncbi:MAG: hypothetical protein LBT98_02250 [Puniceicoccales bacterium]|jgi:hypothetical protein|nr:hypothetical protein [Puniceicoccales bacterium]